jgi:hypothetical protein
MTAEFIIITASRKFVSMLCVPGIWHRFRPGISMRWEEIMSTQTCPVIRVETFAR